MAIEFVLLKTNDYPDDDDSPQRYGGVHCPGCGRFAKYVRTDYYYNGTWDMIDVIVRCSKCGENRIRCV